MSLVTAGCSVAYLGLMVVLITCCLIRRRKMKKMMIAEEIRHVQKDILSAFSSSSSKSGESIGLKIFMSGNLEIWKLFTVLSIYSFIGSFI